MRFFWLKFWRIKLYAWFQLYDYKFNLFLLQSTLIWSCFFSSVWLLVVQHILWYRFVNYLILSMVPETEKTGHISYLWLIFFNQAEWVFLFPHFNMCYYIALVPHWGPIVPDKFGFLNLKDEEMQFQGIRILFLSFLPLSQDMYGNNSTLLYYPFLILPPNWFLF